MWRRWVAAVRGIIVREPIALTIAKIQKLILLLFYGGLFALLPELLPAADCRLRVSPVFRSSLRLKYREKSCSSGMDLSAFLEHLDPEEGIDDLDYADRIFADGYVCQDEGTGKPQTILPDSTWNWGYDSASQYNAENQTLTFRKPVQVRQESMERISSKTGAERESDRINEHCGLEVAVEMPLAECSLSAGWQWIPGWQEKSRFSTFNQNYQLVSSLLDADDHYVYSTYGSELPPPGHAGCSEGPFADPPAPGTLIANRPSSIQRIFSGSSQELTNETLSFRNQVHFKLDCEQQEFWFGPVFRCVPVPWLSCSISPRCNLLYSAVEIKREEKLWQVSAGEGRKLRGIWQHRRDKKSLLTGVSLCAALECNWQSGFFAGLNLAAAWYPENLELHAGPASVDIRPGAFSAGAMVGYRF